MYAPLQSDLTYLYSKFPITSKFLSHSDFSEPETYTHLTFTSTLHVLLPDQSKKKKEPFRHPITLLFLFPLQHVSPTDMFLLIC